jgi:hypothetical protein
VYRRLNVCCVPLPEDGVTDTGAITIVPGTVHVPIPTQELCPLNPSTCIFTFFEPANPAANVTARFTTMSVELTEFALLAPAFSAHWLLLSVFAVPVVIGPRKAEPASFKRNSEFP